jgi:hypothetical protein
VLHLEGNFELLLLFLLGFCQPFEREGQSKNICHEGVFYPFDFVQFFLELAQDLVEVVSDFGVVGLQKLVGGGKTDGVHIVYKMMHHAVKD